MKNYILLAFAFLISSYATFSSNQNNVKTEYIKSKQEGIKSVHIKDGNIYLLLENKKQKQLTFNGSDEKPILIAEKGIVIFVRNVQENNLNHIYTRKKLMSVSIEDMSEKVITEKKPYKDGNDQSYEIFNIDNPTLSNDRNSIYFTTEKWVTSNQLVKVNIEKGWWQELFSANNFTLIKKGPNRGTFLVIRSEIRDKGRDAYYMLVNENGKVMKEFLNEKMAEQFLKSLD